MDKNTEFKWNDKLVQDYIQFYAASYAASVAYFNSDETLEKFKQSKSKKEEPQWEILEVTDKAGKIWERYFYNGDPHICGNNYEYVLQSKIGRIFDIKTVKRFPDNTVWSVGMVTGQGKIKKFQVIGENMLAEVYETCYAFNIDLLTEAPKEEQVPIKVHSLHHLGENSNDAATQIVTSHRIPPSKYQSIKSAIEDVLNEDKIKHEKLLSKIESKVRLANMINTQANYLKETLDYINSLK